MKQEINAYEYAPHIIDHMTHNGILVTAKNGEQVNPITIGWGTIGMQWGKPLFQAYIRECRHTKGMLDEAKEFTVNIPLERTERVKEILKFCGSKSGRDLNKIEELGLTLVEPEKISTPAIAELPVTLECKVVYSVRQDGSQMPEDVLRKYYPDWEQHKEDVHTVYYGEIVCAYIVQ
ncbi:MAG: flavin reductase family protein [Oscillospiraceae bacterium]|nr:flavin reductase family protein [Oscillospiraceae bacterium]